MKLTVDILDDFIQSLDLSGQVLSFSNDGTNTTLNVDKTYHARENMILTVDTVDYNIISVVNNTSIVVESVIANPLVYSVQLPFYFHGTPIATNNHISEADHKDKVPMIYLYEIIREKQKDIFSSIDREADLRLFFLDTADFDEWTTDDHYSKRLLGLNNLVDAFIIQAISFRSQFFLNETEFTRINHVKWGKFTDLKGHIVNIFDDELTGVELSFTLQIRKSC